MADDPRVDPILGPTKVANPDGTGTQYFLRQWNNLIALAKNTAAALAAALAAQTTANGAAAAITAIDGIDLTAGVGLSGGGSIGAHADINFDLEDTAVTPTTYGDAGHYPVITVDQQGRITAATNQATSGGGGGGVFVGYDRQDVHTPTTFGFGFWGGHAVVCDKTTTLNSVQFIATTASASSQFQPVIYANAAGQVPGALLAGGAVLTGVVAGLNTIPLGSPLSVNAGDILWIGVQLNVASMDVGTCSGIGTAFFSTTGNTVQNPAPTATFVNQGWSSMWASE